MTTPPREGRTPPEEGAIEVENRPKKLGFKERIAQSPTIPEEAKRPLIKQALEAQTEQQEITERSALEKLRQKARDTHQQAVDTREKDRSDARIALEKKQQEHTQTQAERTHQRVDDLRKKRGEQTLELRRLQRERDWQDEDRRRERLRTLALAGVTIAGVAALGAAFVPLAVAGGVFTVAGAAGAFSLSTAGVKAAIAGASLLTGTGVAMASRYFGGGRAAREQAQEA